MQPHLVAWPGKDPLPHSLGCWQNLFSWFSCKLWAGEALPRHYRAAHSARPVQNLPRASNLWLRKGRDPEGLLDEVRPTQEKLPWINSRELTQTDLEPKYSCKILSPLSHSVTSARSKSIRFTAPPILKGRGFCRTRTPGVEVFGTLSLVCTPH